MRFCIFIGSFLWLALSASLSMAAEPVAPLAATVKERMGPEKDEDFIDTRIVRDFVESRNLIECRQKCGQLVLAGDVRAKWNAANTNRFNRDLHAFQPVGHTHGFKSEFNLFMDYTTKNSWVSTKVRWTVLDAVEPQTVKTELDRAFIGYDIYECGDEDFYIEVGRSKLDYLFESRVEFTAPFNGIHFYYTNKFRDLGLVTLHGGPFVINSESNHYGVVGELGFRDLGFTGFIVKYSFIDWHRFARTPYVGSLKKDEVPETIRNNPRYRFLVSQLIFGYEKGIDVCGCKLLYAYAAVLANHLAQKSPLTDFSYGNKAWYVGFTLGKLCKAGDWSFDINYQWVGPQAIPDFDISGIGRGRSNGLLSDQWILYRQGSKFHKRDASGFGNFRGFQMSALYALTDTLSFRARAQWSRPARADVGNNFRYKEFEFVVIYAF